MAGPPDMVAATIQTLGNAGVNEDDIRTEEFAGYRQGEWTLMLELMSCGFTGPVSILLFAFCFACKGESSSLNDKPLSGPMYDAELRHPRPVERCVRAANGDPAQQGQKHEGALHG
jgi:hypothetical protein